MADEGTLELYMASDQTPYFDVKTTKGGATAQTMTGWSLLFVVRRRSDNAVVVSKTTASGIAIGNGDGTDDRATVTLGETDIVGWTEGREYKGALWRTDTDVPLWSGVVWLREAAPQI